MPSLEKLIKYDQAILEPAAELSLSDDGGSVKLKGLEDLVFLCHFNGTSGPSHPFFALAKEETEGTDLCGAACVAFDYAVHKFGTSSLLQVAEWGPGTVICKPPKSLVFAPELTVDFWARFEDLQTGAAERSLIDRYRILPSPTASWMLFIIDGEIGLRLNTTNGQCTLQTSGLEMEPSTWHHIRAAWTENGHAMKIFLNGSLVAQGDFSGTVKDSDDPAGQNPLEIMFSAVPQNAWMDELRIFNSFKGDEFTPPDSPTQPFSSRIPRAKLSLDAGYNNATWILSELNFQNETDFQNDGIKIRLHGDNDNSPEFDGDPLSLDQARALDPLVARWLHLEFNFVSDGDTLRTLTSGKIGLKPEASIWTRREPEISRRF